MSTSTLSRKVHGLLVSSLAIKELHYVFPFVIWSGLIDLQPDLLPGDAALNSVCVLNAGATVKGEEGVITPSFPTQLISPVSD